MAYPRSREEAVANLIEFRRRDEMIKKYQSEMKKLAAYVRNDATAGLFTEDELSATHMQLVAKHPDHASITDPQ